MNVDCICTRRETDKVKRDGHRLAARYPDHGREELSGPGDVTEASMSAADPTVPPYPFQPDSMVARGHVCK
jgi:hypothetical protein